MSSEISLVHKVHRLSYFLLWSKRAKVEMLIKYLQKDILYMQSILTAWLYSFKSPTAAITLPSSAWSHNAHICTFSTESKSIQPQKLHLPQGKFTQAELSHRVEPWWTLSEDATQSVTIAGDTKNQTQNLDNFALPKQKVVQTGHGLYSGGVTISLDCFKTFVIWSQSFQACLQLFLWNFPFNSVTWTNTRGNKNKF